MKKEKYSYDFEIVLALRHFKKNFAGKGLMLDTRYIDFFGDTCPRCKTKFKVYGNDVKNAASVSAFLVMEQKKAVVYCICKKCAKELTKTSTIENDARKTEEYIFSKLSDLKREDNESLNEKEFDKEMDLLNDLN